MRADRKSSLDRAHAERQQKLNTRRAPLSSLSAVGGFAHTLGRSVKRCLLRSCFCDRVGRPAGGTSTHMGVLDAPYQPRSSEWDLGGQERITGEPPHLGPGPGTYGLTSYADCGSAGAAPAYSFGCAPSDRGAPINSLSPGPGAYQITPYADGTASQSGVSFGGGQPRMDPPIVGAGPGPGAYTPHDMSHQAPAYSIGGAKLRGSNDWLDMSPGPGAYDPNAAASHHVGPAYSIGGDKSSRSVAQAGEPTPGPGTYQPMGATEHAAPAYSIGGAHRRTDSASQADTPGPGAYTPGIAAHCAPAYSVGAGLRSSASQPSSLLNSTPGPGSYNNMQLEVNKHSGPAYSIASKPAEPATLAPTRTPGPGSYTPLNESSKYHRASAYSIGGQNRQTGEVTKHASSTPGPGAYDSDMALKVKKHNGPAFSIASKPRSAESKFGQERSPGPGSYTPTMLTKSNSAAFSMGRPSSAKPSRRISADVSPGPSSYTPGLVNKFSASAFSMGRPSTARRAADRVNPSPGPGSYTPTAIRQHSAAAFSMGAAKRKPKEVLDPTPGPGSYKPDLATKYRAPAVSIKGKSNRDSFTMAAESTPGPGQYFSVAKGEAYSETTRKGDKMLANSAADKARRGRGGGFGTAPRFTDSDYY